MKVNVSTAIQCEREIEQQISSWHKGMWCKSNITGDQKRTYAAIDRLNGLKEEIGKCVWKCKVTVPDKLAKKLAKAGFSIKKS